jgi:hypothetical protein
LGREEWTVDLPYVTVLDLAFNQLRGQLSSFRMASPALLNLNASQATLTCPLPEFDFSTTAVIKPGCLPDWRSLVLPGALAMGFMAGGALLLMFGVQREHAKSATFAAAYAMRGVSFVAMGLFFSEVFVNLSNNDSPVCTPINARSVFEPFMNQTFSSDGGAWPRTGCCQVGDSTTHVVLFIALVHLRN